MMAYKPLLPPEAEAEIMGRLSAKMRISSDEIAAILERHGVSGDAESLQSAYRKRLGQRLMSSIRDEGGKRELLAAGSEYVVVECCNDPQKLKAIQRRLQGNINGLDASAKKVRGRIRFLNRFSPGKKGGAADG
ncbi:MAG: synapsin-1 (Synapsin I) [Oscillospiraceae bacterium]|nr:synapsin-1 (Synapsin I) [Oscillospiraceae bacterium]